MSRYVGWNEQVSKKVHSGHAGRDLRVQYSNSTATTQAMGTFTPINLEPSTRSEVNGTLRTRSRGIDNGTLYDLSDLQLSGSPAPKRRRKASMKPACPKKTSTPVLTHPWPRIIEKESSQLSIPPDSKKWSSKRSATQVELFYKANVTKPVLGPMKPMTTEDAFKATSVSLGRTTMDKLVSYRFQPAACCLPDAEAQEIVDSLEGIAGEPEKAEGLNSNSSNHEEECPYSTYDNHSPMSYLKEDVFVVMNNRESTSRGTGPEKLYHEFDNIRPTNYGEQGPDTVLDEATLLDCDEEMIMVARVEASMSQRETTQAVQYDEDEDFPVDDDFEAEMAQLLVPDKNNEAASASLPLLPLQNEYFQSAVTGRADFQRSTNNSSSNTTVGDINAANYIRRDSNSSASSALYLSTFPRPLDLASDWPSMNQGGHDGAFITKENRLSTAPFPENLAHTMSLIESDDYLPLKAFARPGFPAKVRDRSPIAGVSSSIILRTCFRIGEAIRQGALCDGSAQDTVIELFARVRESSCDAAVPSKLCFEFADLFHDRPPFVRGTFENSRVSGLQETESRMLVGVNGSAPMARCLGRLKRVIAGPLGWTLYIINIRPTDWEEVRWTRQIAGAGMAK